MQLPQLIVRPIEPTSEITQGLAQHPNLPLAGLMPGAELALVRLTQGRDLELTGLP